MPLAEFSYEARRVPLKRRLLAEPRNHSTNAREKGRILFLYRAASDTFDSTLTKLARRRPLSNPSRASLA
jgi:hypothetical protein